MRYGSCVVVFCVELRLVSVVFVGAGRRSRLTVGFDEDDTVILCWRGLEGAEVHVIF